MLPVLRDRKGRYIRGWSLTKKGYPRYHAGPHRGKYVHRVQMELLLGRPLKKDEDVHHENGDKADFSPRNLRVIDHRLHGYVSSKQRFVVEKILEEKEKQWYSVCNEQRMEPVHESGTHEDLYRDSADCSFDPANFASTGEVSAPAQ